MRWDELFSDLEAQMSAARDDHWRAEVAERTRGERGAVELGARLAGARGARIGVVLADATLVEGPVRDSGRGWLLLQDEGGREHLIVASAIAAVRELGAVAHHVSEVERRLGLGHALRALSRDRPRVRVRTHGGEVVGVIAAVLADHADIAAESPRGSRASVPFTSLLEVVAT